MPHYPYLIVGAGMTADAAVRGIRELDAQGAIGVIGTEADPPYARPPLTKALWKGDPLDSVWKWTAQAGAQLHLGRRATALDLGGKTVTDDGGATYTYDKLLLATGGTPRRLGSGAEHVLHFRSLADYRILRELAKPDAAIAVIGGGFIGSELAAALSMSGCKVTMLFPDAGIGGRIFPADLAAFLAGYYRERGVDVRQGEKVTGVAPQRGKLEVETKSGFRATVDAVVAGLGIVPNTELAEAAGIEVEDGIPVDLRLRTSDPSVFAAGDVARFESPQLGKRLRVEHEDNALTMGKAAGRSMAGDDTPYTHLPFFYSDLFDLGYEAVGEMDSRLETEADWKEQFREGVVTYRANGKVRGVLNWNVWGQVDAARERIEKGV
ncbi:MAG TPA: FAD-dependent oxidoreductase [Candidatus Bathyarchaeia archaeon]|nr:FAD-dependent oxidoreductase [Candidatus Bathyarchaeia archaeon]